MGKQIKFWQGRLAGKDAYSDRSATHKPTKKDEAKVTVSDKELRTAIAGRKHFRENKQYKEAALMAKYAQQLAKTNSDNRINQKNKPHSWKI